MKGMLIMSKTVLNHQRLRTCASLGLVNKEVLKIVSMLDSETIAYHNAAQTKHEVVAAYNESVDVQKQLINAYVDLAFKLHESKAELHSFDLLIDQIDFMLGTFIRTKHDSALTYIQTRLDQIKNFRIEQKKTKPLKHIVKH